MRNKPFVPNALELAEDVARIIFEYSYRREPETASDEFYGVHDLLLFGSVLSGKSFKPSDGKTPHDIDMLIIHNMDQLNELGVITLYDPEIGQDVPNMEADITKDEFKYMTTTAILSDMGSLFSERTWSIRDYIMSELTAKMRSGHLKGDEDFGGYSGKIKLAYIGSVDVPFQRDTGKVHGYIEKIIDEKIMRETVIHKTISYLKKNNLDMQSTLDLIVMNKDLLNPNKAQEHREMALKQSSDPTFWNSILISGRLYNKSTGKFDTPLGTKYPDGAELFNPKKQTHA